MCMFKCMVCENYQCTCGHEYRDWDRYQIEKQIGMLYKVLADRVIVKTLDQINFPRGKSETENLIWLEEYCSLYNAFYYDRYSDDEFTIDKAKMKAAKEGAIIVIVD